MWVWVNSNDLISCAWPLARWHSGLTGMCVSVRPEGDWIFRSRLTYGCCFRQSVFELVTCLRLHAECAEGEVYRPVMLASLNHYFWIMRLFSCSCCHIHVRSLVKVSLARIRGGMCDSGIFSRLGFLPANMLLYLTFQLSTHCPPHFLVVHPFLSKLALFDLLHVSEHYIAELLSWGGGEQTDQHTYPDRFHRQAVNSSSLTPSFFV